MAIRGQKFNLNLDADNFQFDVQDGPPTPPLDVADVVKDINEREPSAPPPPPKLNYKSRSGFPAHRSRKNISALNRQESQPDRVQDRGAGIPQPTLGPSDRAIVNHLGKKHGFDTEAQEKADISEENKRRLAQMSIAEIDEARTELLSGLNPALIQRLLRRANIDEDSANQDWDNESATAQNGRDDNSQTDAATFPRKRVVFQDQDLATQDNQPNEDIGRDQDLPLPHSMPTTHFPVPPRNPSAFTTLDPNSETFLEDLRTHYFPDTPHDPHSLAWLQDPTEEERSTSAYAPTQYSYAPSDIRFDFAGRLIPPSEAETIASTKGLHHHGDAPNSAGYTIPELAMLCRSSLPNQRCIAYLTLGRILYRLGKGQFGPKGTELHEGLWGCVEHERPLEVIMAEANRDGGHMSAKAYATEALWFWRKGGGGERGISKQGQRIVR